MPYLEKAQEPLGFGIITDSEKQNEIKSALVNVWETSILNEDQQERDTIHKLCDPTLTPDIKSFMVIFNEYTAKMRSQWTLFADPDSSDERPATKANKKRLKQRNITNYNLEKREAIKIKRIQKEKEREHYNLSQNFVSKIAERCLTNVKIFEEPLKYLIKSDCLYTCICPELISMLIENNHMELLGLCLMHVHDISEVDLIKILKFVLTDVKFIPKNEKKK